MRLRYQAGRIGYREAKETLVWLIDRELAPVRRRYPQLRPDEEQLLRILADGASRARAQAGRTLE
jgi:tryptophanyl-tRNA synthetase